MRWRKRLVVIAAGGTLVGLLACAFLEGRAELDSERESDKPVKVPPRLERTKNGAPVVVLDADAQLRSALETRPVTAANLPREVIAYGRIIEDPASTFQVRSPITGILRPVATTAWPNLGDRLRAGTVVGTVAPRFTPTDRLDLTARLTTAQGDAHSARAGLATARAAYAHARALNGDVKIIADRVVEERRAKVASEEARLGSALRTVDLLSGLAGTLDRSNGAPVTVIATGEVIDETARPGEPVESGQVLLTTARYDQPLAQIEEIPGEDPVPIPTTARIAPIGHLDAPAPATRIALPPRAAGSPPGRTLLMRLDRNPLELRPGQPVVAYLSVSGARALGVLIPASALVWAGGRQWAYQQVGPGRYCRRPVEVDSSVGGMTGGVGETAVLITKGLDSSHRVVCVGAQLLLSEEMKGAIQILEDGDE